MSLRDEELGFILVCAAGLSTAIGAGVVYSTSLIKLASKAVLASSLGLAAGVMMFVSFIEIFSKSQGAFLDDGQDDNDAFLFANLCFFGGYAIMIAIDKLVHYMNPYDFAHEDVDFEMIDDIVQRDSKSGSEAPKPVAKGEISEFGIAPCDSKENSLKIGVDDSKDDEECGEEEREISSETTPEAAAESEEQIKDRLQKKRKHVDRRLKRMGMMTALAIAIHNFPEGLATFVATLSDPSVGAALAVAIAIHNIPEGLCVSVPIYFATGERHRAFLWGVVSGISEIVGAGLGWIILKDHFTDLVYGILFGMVAGMMVNICIHQLLPTARRYDPTDTVTSYSFLAGMIIMAISLIVFQY
jgi:ZIP family zinc transporter